MSIIRTHRTSEFTVIPNELLNDPELTDTAGFLLVYLLSKPNDWQVNIKIIANCGRFGSHGKVCKSLAMLRQLGYAKLIRLPSGHTEWVISDTKGNLEASIQEPHSQKRNEGQEPHSEKPHSDFRNVLQRNDLRQRTECFAYAHAHEDLPDESPTVNDSTPRRGQLSAFLRQQGVTITPIHPDLCQWVNSDITDEEAQEAVDRARQRKPGNTPIPAKYLAPIVADVISERAERLKKCPAVAATTPGALSSTNPNRGHHHARQNATQQRASINTFLRNASNPDGVVELTPEQFEHHRLAVSENGGMLREPLDFSVSGGRRVNHPFLEVVEQHPVWVN